MISGNYFVSLAAALCLGARPGGGVSRGAQLHRGSLPSQSGTAFSTIFFVALLGNMTINKSFALAQIHGVEQYTVVMLGCLALSAILLWLVVKQLRQHPIQSTPSKS